MDKINLLLVEHIEEEALQVADHLGEISALNIDIHFCQNLGESYEKLRKRRKGFSKKDVEEIIESGGKLNWAQVLRCKTRYFTDGLVMGSRQFVESYFQELKEKTGQYEKRKTGARKIRQVDNAEEETIELFTMRDLQKDRLL